MGSFSFTKADKLTKVSNILTNKTYKFLIPKEFGGGFIKEKYKDYGLLGGTISSPEYDMYELVAFWNNHPGVKYDGEFPLMKKIDKYTDHNRSIGIDIGCYDEDIAKLKYPLKLVSPTFKGTYEDLHDCSLYDKNQGWFPSYRPKQED